MKAQIPDFTSLAYVLNNIVEEDLMKKIFYSLILLFLILPGCFIHSGSLYQAFAFNEKEFDGHIILGRPTNTEITARIIASNPTSVFLEYGKESDHYTHKTEQFLASREEPANIIIDELDEGCKYYYRLCFAVNNLNEMACTEAYSFTTARGKGKSFTFVIQSDSHLLNKADKGIYQKVMENIAAVQPDFFFDLGDTFLNDKDMNASFDTINDITYEQVPFFSTAAKYSPLFLVIGNHEGEYGYLLDGTAKNMPVYAALSRKQYFPNPVPNDFYSGNSANEDFIGQPDNPDTGIVYSYTISESGEFDVLKSTDDHAAFAAYSNYDSVKNKKQGQQKKQDERENKNTKKKNNKESKEVQVELSEDVYGKTFLGRPTDRSISISTAFKRETQYYYQYGTTIDNLNKKTMVKTASPGTVQAETITFLQSGTKYYYQLCQKNNEKEKYNLSKVFSFHTQCPPGSEYTFLVEADPHLDENSDGNIYESILSGMLKQEADFIIDLGDSSMAEKLASNQEEIVERNILLRSCWDNIAHSIPFFMIMGNHDGEVGWNNKGTNPIADLAASSRRTYFPNPTSDTFYFGLNDTTYAWEWGDALFIALDPFSFTDKKPQFANWQWTLGKEQYDWLKNTLEQSNAKYKFVFIHHLVGGVDEFARGGAEAASLFEWGGNDLKGIYSFDKMRSGWEMPIHQVLKENGVDIVFHGHDHFYAREELDGIIYQLVPQPSSKEKKQNNTVLAEEYGYKDGIFLSSPGFLRITVRPDFAKIDYLQGTKGEIADSYRIE